MASTTPLQLFPAPHRTAVPRKSSMKKTVANDVYAAPGELRGVAIQVTPPSLAGGPPLVQPADDHIKHSLFCDDHASSSQQYVQTRPKRHLRLRRNSSASDCSTPSTAFSCDESADRATPLPVNTSFGSPPTSPRRHPASQLQRPAVPLHMSVEVLPDEEMTASPNGDKPSPLPTKDCLGMLPMRSEFPSAMSVRSASPTLVRSNSGASTRKGALSPEQPAKSIFPQYDHTRAFHEQRYYPSARSPTPTLPAEKISKLGSPEFERPGFERVDSAIALVDGYEHIRVAQEKDLTALWNASRDIFPCAGAKVQLGLLQPSEHGTSLAIGVSADHLLYSMSKVTSSPEVKGTNAECDLAVTKHCPAKSTTPKGTIQTVAQMDLPKSMVRTSKQRLNDDVVAIFPQMAAIKAIENVSNSPIAKEIAYFDPTAEGPEAIRLAQDAVAAAHAHFRCELVRAARKRDSLGAVTATYRLEHPRLGPFAITITKSTAGGRHARDPRAKISIHHPSATPAAIGAETLVLATLDFARSACVLDIPGLLALEGPYVIDTVVCSLLAVAVIENDALMAENVTFDAPPKAPVAASKRKTSQSDASVDDANGRRWWGRSNKKSKKQKKIDEGQVELPLATEAALGLLGFGFKTAVFVLEVGVKVAAGLVMGATNVAKKL